MSTTDYAANSGELVPESAVGRMLSASPVPYQLNQPAGLTPSHVTSFLELKTRSSSSGANALLREQRGTALYASTTLWVKSTL